MKTIKMPAPTHKFAASVYIAVLDNPKADDHAKEVAREELIFMGALADERNVFAKKLRKLEEIETIPADEGSDPHSDQSIQGL